MFQLSQLLKDKGIRPSWQRLAILKYMQSNKMHPSAEEVYESLSLSLPTLSQATVYNTLNLFASRGVIKSMNVFGAQKHYDGIMTNHGHIICPICGKIEDFIYEDNETEFLNNIKSRTDAKDVEIVINKVCDKCKSN